MKTVKTGNWIFQKVVYVLIIVIYVLNIVIANEV